MYFVLRAEIPTSCLGNGLADRPDTYIGLDWLSFTIAMSTSISHRLLILEIILGALILSGKHLTVALPTPTARITRLIPDDTVGESEDVCFVCLSPASFSISMHNPLFLYTPHLAER